ncbi:hypothetical protein [Atopobium sp. BV3Ac4]|uniref:hypothetical protein n=1 Tax=Atopobium sp. BV3Ac4 TaxID=1111121 RepID=UPI0003AE1C46|nr:hypothetical protein [Atopobium sp. BV3Ac4]ERL15156.1 hypothetical protein HMPREF1247_0855 [Atopobium sp. BV3Ac4]
MTTNILVTGKQGKNHITSAQMGAIQAAIFGPGTYICSGFEPSMASANALSITKGVAVVNGRPCVLEANTQVNIASGITGRNRNDLVVLAYSKVTSSGVEEVTVKTISGEATTSDAADPTYKTGDILSGDTSVETPLFRVEVRGLNLPKVVTLAKKLPSIADLDAKNTKESETQVFDYKSGENSLYAVRVGKIVYGTFTLTPNLDSAWASQVMLTMPEGMRPAHKWEVSCTTENKVANVALYIDTNGRTEASNRGGQSLGNNYIHGSFAYPVI